MFRPRIIPVLLLRNQTLVKTVQFKNPNYIGDPINAVRIFNDLKADELVFLDILASKENRTVSLEFVKNVGEEANMPFAVGGGIKTIEQIQTIIAAGSEKVVLNTVAVQNTGFVKQASDAFGSSTIAVCMDVKRKLFGHQQSWILGGSKPTGLDPVIFAKMMEQSGAGEIIVQSIEHDGMMNGYDLDLISKVSKAVTIPVVALGGAGTLSHMNEAYNLANANALAAGSLFVYHGSQKGVLINYPEKEELQHFFKKGV